MTGADTIERMRAILLKEWDPIGIADEPAAQDEYDSYAPVVARMVLDDASAEAIADHLLSIEREQMCLRGEEANARSVSELLVTLRAG